MLNSHLEVIWFLRNYHPITGIIYFVYIISACAFNGKLNGDNTMNEVGVAATGYDVVLCQYGTYTAKEEENYDASWFVAVKDFQSLHVISNILSKFLASSLHDT